MDFKDDRVTKALIDRDISLLRELSKKIQIIFILEAIHEVIDKDDIETFTFLFEHNFMTKFYNIKQCIRQGAFKIVKYLLDKGFYIPNDLKCCIQHSIEMVELCIYNMKNTSNLPLALTVNLEVLTYLFEDVGIRFDMSDVLEIIYARRFDLLPYAVDRCDNLNLLNTEVLEAATNQANLEHGVEILEYLLDRGFVYSPRLSMMPAYRGYLETIKIFHKRGLIIHNDSKSSFKNVDNYLHEHHIGIYNRPISTCERCHHERTTSLIDLWFLEDYTYKHYHQWLPKEMMEDIICLFRDTKFEISF